MYENGKMRHVETIPGMQEGSEFTFRRMMEGVNSTMIYCKNFCKCNKVPPVQHHDNNNNNKNKIKPT
jgi:hypothetical protein